MAKLMAALRRIIRRKPSADAYGDMQRDERVEALYTWLQEDRRRCR